MINFELEAEDAKLLIDTCRATMYNPVFSGQKRQRVAGIVAGMEFLLNEYAEREDTEEVNTKPCCPYCGSHNNAVYKVVDTYYSNCDECNKIRKVSV